MLVEVEPPPDRVACVVPDFHPADDFSVVGVRAVAGMLVAMRANRSQRPEWPQRSKRPYRADGRPDSQGSHLRREIIVTEKLTLVIDIADETMIPEWPGFAERAMEHGQFPGPFRPVPHRRNENGRVPGVIANGSQNPQGPKGTEWPGDAQTARAPKMRFENTLSTYRRRDARGIVVVPDHGPWRRGQTRRGSDPHHESCGKQSPTNKSSEICGHTPIDTGRHERDQMILANQSGR